MPTITKMKYKSKSSPAAEVNLAPPDSESNMGNAEIMVAGRLKQLRKEKGLTLSQLASAAGFSTGFLSRIENYKLSVRIVTLEKLAEVLGVSISAFFEDESDRILLALCRKGKAPRSIGPRGFLFETLVGQKKGKLMEPLIVDISSVPKTPQPQPHSGEEFNYILEGECELIYGKKTIRLRPGDSVYYDASVPHSTGSVSGKPCRILVVVASRDYLFHGDLSRLLNADGPAALRRT